MTPSRACRKRRCICLSAEHRKALRTALNLGAGDPVEEGRAWWDLEPLWKLVASLAADAPSEDCAWLCPLCTGRGNYDVRGVMVAVPAESWARGAYVRKQCIEVPVFRRTGTETCPACVGRGFIDGHIARAKLLGWTGGGTTRHRGPDRSRVRP